MVCDMRFLDVKIVENTVTKLVPVLFENYEDGLGDFAYLGGHQGQAKLESALAQPQQTFGGEYLYETIADKAAALLWSITKNHPFVDGNKRAALTTVNLFLIMNGWVMLASQKEAVGFCRRVAGHGAPVEQDEVAAWIAQRIISVVDPEFDQRYRAFITESYSDAEEDLVAGLNFLRAAIEGVQVQV